MKNRAVASERMIILLLCAAFGLLMIWQLCLSIFWRYYYFAVLFINIIFYMWKKYFVSCKKCINFANFFRTLKKIKVR